MPTSPLQFARDFAKLKSRLAQAAANDQRLLTLLEFWPKIEPLRKDTSYSSYLEEFRALLTQYTTESGISDLSITELSQLVDMTSAIAEDGKEDTALRIPAVRLASLQFYVGDIEGGARSLGYLVDEAATSEACTETQNGLNERDLFNNYRDQVKGHSEALDQLLAEIAAEWEAARESYYHDRVNCLFVEKNGSGEAGRGRLRTVMGSVETRKNQSQTDDIAFDSKVRSPDDPFVGVAYDSLAAVRKILSGLDTSSAAKVHYHAHFNMEDSDHEFTGDSIGLALAFLSYAQLLKPEMLRLERFISGEVAFTGGIEPDGTLTPVNDETLPAKIERAFFSPLRYVVLPQANVDVATTTLERLNQRYPNRHLKLITANHLSEVIEDHNVIRSEKMCIGEFVAKRAYRYGRNVKVQIPVLIVLLAIFAALYAQLFPKQMPWFDDNPALVQFSSSGAQVLNADSTVLWTRDWTCGGIDASSQWRVHDIDGNGTNEVLMIPSSESFSACASVCHLLGFDSKGLPLFDVNCVYSTVISEESEPDQGVVANELQVVETGGGLVIVTIVYTSSPAVTHFRFWNTAGRPVGWYVSKGHMGCRGADLAWNKEGELLALGFDNNMDRASFVALSPNGSQGVCPTLRTAGLPYSRIPGNQRAYILFPRTDVNAETHSTYNYPEGIKLMKDGTIQIDINEVESDSEPIRYMLDGRFRVIAARPHDGFFSYRDKLVAKGRLPEVSRLKYARNLFNSIEYWCDSTWYTESELRAQENPE